MIFLSTGTVRLKLQLKFKNTTVYFVSNDSSGVTDCLNLTPDESLPTKQAVVFLNFNSDFNATDSALVFIIEHKALQFHLSQLCCYLKLHHFY